MLQSTGTHGNICASHFLQLLPLAPQGMDEDGEHCSAPQEGIPLVLLLLSSCQGFPSIGGALKVALPGAGLAAENLQEPCPASSLPPSAPSK